MFCKNKIFSLLILSKLTMHSNTSRHQNKFHYAESQLRSSFVWDAKKESIYSRVCILQWNHRLAYEASTANQRRDARASRALARARCGLVFKANQAHSQESGQCTIWKPNEMRRQFDEWSLRTYLNFCYEWEKSNPRGNVKTVSYFEKEKAQDGITMLENGLPFLTFHILVHMK